MKEYIEREKVLHFCREIINSHQSTQRSRLIANSFNNFAVFVNNLPAADVRPVVLCRDCRWWAKEEKSLQGRNTGMNICRFGGFYSTGEWFCANGERPNCGAQMKEETK